MRVLVCGSRHFNDYNLLKDTLDDFPISVIIEGEAKGADTLAAKYGEEKALPVERFPANWELYGRRAGPIRNSQMLREGQPELVIAFMFPDSRGTKNMVEQAKKAGIETVVINCE